MKIDVSKIEGYEEMSAEEKIVALESFELEAKAASSDEVEKLRAAVSKANGEAAEYKKQLRERMTEAEKAEAERQTQETEREAERQAEQQSIMAELEKLRNDKALSDSRARFLSLGFDDELAGKTAAAFVGGDMDTVFKNHSNFIASRDEKIRAESIRSMPLPNHKEPAPTEPYTPPEII